MGVGVAAASSARLCTDAAAASSDPPRGARRPGERDGDLFWRATPHPLSRPCTRECRQLQPLVVPNTATGEQLCTVNHHQGGGENNSVMETEHSLPTAKSFHATSCDGVCHVKEVTKRRSASTWSVWGARWPIRGGQSASAAAAASPPGSRPSAGRPVALQQSLFWRRWRRLRGAAAAAAAAGATGGRASRRRSRGARAGTPAWAAGSRPAAAPVLTKRPCTSPPATLDGNFTG